MRMARIKVRGRGAVYHCISRVVGGEMLLGALEKEKLREMMWQQARFCGVEIVTYCLMSNHIHVVVRVPEKGVVRDEELVERAVRFYGRRSVMVQAVEKAMGRQGGLPKDVREGLEGRMGDVSVFMKELKQRFSKWYNRGRERYGTLWAERFKSVVVEDAPSVVMAVAAYVDLNAVRAGLVKEPQEYRWSGYGEAVGGGEEARRGLASIQGGGQWGEVEVGYRRVLLVSGGEAGGTEKVALSGEAIRRELKRGGVLRMGQVLRLRVRYFTDGVVLGSRNYVNGLYGEYRDRFGPRRRSGARPMRGVEALGDLATMRDLRVDAVG